MNYLSGKAFLETDGLQNRVVATLRRYFWFLCLSAFMARIFIDGIRRHRLEGYRARLQMGSPLSTLSGAPSPTAIPWRT